MANPGDDSDAAPQTHLYRERVEYRLRERERFLRTLIGNLPGIVYRCHLDDAGTFEFISDGVELLGYDAIAFMGPSPARSWHSLVHEADRERVHAEIKNLSAHNFAFSVSPSTLSYRLVTATHEVKHVRDRFRFIYSDAGNPIAREGFVMDVTELVDADERAKTLESRYRLLAENMNDLVGLLQPESGTYVYLSPSCERILGFEAEDLLNTAAHELIHPSDLTLVEEATSSAMRAGERARVAEHRMRRKSGEYVWLETLFQRVDTDDANRSQQMTCSRDITTRKAAELDRQLIERERAEALVRATSARADAEVAKATLEKTLAEAELARLEAVQANRAKDEFLQMVSHEFRTPLTTIKTAAAVLLNDGDSEAERRAHIETIATECDRQIDMIINLLDVSRLEEGSVDLKHEAVDLGSVLRACDRIERSAAEVREQTLAIDLRPDLPAVRGDAQALRRSLCTIIENAVKYTPERGHIEVRAEVPSPTEVAVHVTDNGRGIRPADLPHIFEKFYRGVRSPYPATDGTADDATGRAETPGVGLGLYLAHRLVRALDGRIEVRSEQGRGSRFTVFLPRWDDSLDHVDKDDEYGFHEPGSSS